MKKLFIIFGGLVFLLLLAAYLTPILFKDQIKEKIDAQIAESVNAHVYFDPSKFNISLFRNFPNVTVSLDDFGVVGKDEFVNDTLISVSSLKTVVNLKSILFDKQMRVSGIYLHDPKVNIKVLENGKSNYDIMKDAEEGTEEGPNTETESDLVFGIDKWLITNGSIKYNDLPLQTYVEIKGLEHHGKGDFTLDIFDIHANTVINSITAQYEGIEYLSRKRLESDMVLNMNMPEFRFSFKENFVKLNDFSFGFDGFIAMPKDDIDMDIRFSSKDNTFKSILSLVPGVFMEGYENIKTDGRFTFAGFAKGTYSDVKETMPSFNFHLKVDDGTLQYPDLPVAIKDILIDLEIDNHDGVLENTSLDVRNFQMNMGRNPVKMNLKVKGLEKPEIKAKAVAKINLEDFNSMIPMQGTSLKGNFDLDISANGIYDQAKNIVPLIDMKMNLLNGQIKTAEFPIPLEDINVKSSVVNKSGKMEETFVNIDNMNMVMDGERLSASAFLHNMNDYTWNVKLDGGVDLEKITKIYPLEGMQLSGKINGHLETKGKMSDLESEQYDKMPTSGSVNISNFKYNGEDLPQGFSITSAKATFNPDKLSINHFKGAAGKSTFELDGYLSNYIGYLFKDEVVKGVMNFYSAKFDLNEWMAEEEGTATEENPIEEAMEALAVPANINFVLKSKLDEVLYDNLSLENMTGDIIVKEGMVRMVGLKFNSLGGQFFINGSYDPRNIKNPLFDFDMNIKDLSIKSAYENFNTVKAIAPISENIRGTFSTDFKIAGKLDQNMGPVYNTLSGKGLIKVARAAIVDSKIMNMVSSTTKLSGSNEVTLNDLVLKAEIKDNKLTVEPFDILIGNFKTTVSGNNSLDGFLNYKMKLDIPAGSAGNALNSIITSISGNSPSGSSNVMLNLNIGGTYDKPTVGLGKAEVIGGPAESVKSNISSKTEAVKEEIILKQKETEEKLKEEKERLKKEAEEKAKQEGNKLKDKAKENLKNVLKKL